MKFIRPVNGSERCRRFFAWLPVRCGKETRWLETVTVDEIYSEFGNPGWKVRRFIDTDEDVTYNE